VTLLSLGSGSEEHKAGPRVGIRVGTEVHWRFWIDGEPTVSAFRGTPRRHVRGKT
jgi:DNA-3-methyladenine glycosylase